MQIEVRSLVIYHDPQGWEPLELLALSQGFFPCGYWIPIDGGLVIDMAHIRITPVG